AAALALFFAASVAALWIADLHHVVTSLLLDSDLELLLRAPLSRLQLLLLKLVDSVPRTVPAVLVVALPVGIAFGRAYGAPLWGWLLLPLQLAALWATPIGLGVAGGLLLAAGASHAWLEEALARVAGTTRSPRGATGGRLPATASRAMILKDARLLLRDWPVLADVVMAALLWTVLPLVLTPIRRGPPL